MPDDIVWEDIRVAYETTSETKKEIARRFGVSEDAIYRYAKKHDWILRPSGTAALLIAGAKRAAGITSTSTNDLAPQPKASARKKATAKSKAKTTLDIASPTKPRKEAGTDTHQLAIVKRLYDVTDAKLAVIESRIASGKRLVRIDADHEAREIAAILKTIEKLKELSDAFARTAAASGGTKPGTASAATAALIGDAERLRQDLAERFERLKVSGGNATASE